MSTQKLVGIGVGLLMLATAGAVGLSRGCSPAADDHHTAALLGDAGEDADHDASRDNPMGNAAHVGAGNTPSPTPSTTQPGCTGIDCPSPDRPGPQPDPTQPAAGATTPPASDGGVVYLVPDTGVENPPQQGQTRVGCIGNDCPGRGVPPQPDPAAVH